jgi:peptidoglycan hydrolase CwlO-like protein
VSNVPTVWAVVIGIVIAVFGSAGVSTLLTVRPVNKKTMSAAKLDEESADKADAEARKLISEAGVVLLQPLMKRARELEQQLAAAQTELAALRSQIGDLTKEVTELRDENDRLRDVKPWTP